MEIAIVLLIIAVIFIARSVKSEVRCEPVIEDAA